jgi:Thioredoxin reductase
VECDVCIIGGGSAGIGAALASARRGLRTILVEKEAGIGGNAVLGGVHNWEPGVGGTAFPREIYDRMAKLPCAAGVWSIGRHWCWPDSNRPPFPGGELIIDPRRDYGDTLRRYGTRGLLDDEDRVRSLWHGVIFEPEAYVSVIERLLAETGNCLVFTNCRMVDVATSGDRIQRVMVTFKGGETAAISARYFVDSTAGVHLGRALGCETWIGEDPASRFGEPSAPEVPNSQAINAVTLIYRVAKTDSSRIEELPPNVPDRCWYAEGWTGASIGTYPCGDRNINMLPTMEGSVFLEYLNKGEGGYFEAYDECRRRVFGHWHHLQVEYPEFRKYRISWIAPTLGVREGPRVVGRYVLREQDVRGGISSQSHDDIIAVADHALDLHGSVSKGCFELDEPYGVPFRCLLPAGWENLLVAGRGASFSHIAASSCRLSRTMMDLGHAAGVAVAVASETEALLSEVNVRKIQDELIRDGASLKEYLWDFK